MNTHAVPSVPGSSGFTPTLYDAWSNYLINRSIAPDDLAIRLVLVSASAISTLCCLWACFERVQSGRGRDALRVQLAQITMAMLFRDALLGMECEGLVVRGPNPRYCLRFGRGDELLGACLQGPDADSLGDAIDSLDAQGVPFEMTARTNDMGTIRLVGRPVGGCIAISAHAVSVPAVAVPEVDWTARESALCQQIEELDCILDRLPVAVAVFGADSRLRTSNRAFSERFGLVRSWLDGNPSLERILDSLRSARLLPEQREYRAFKARLLALFEQQHATLDDTWHLPNGRCERVSVEPNAFGGRTLLFEDLTGQVETERSYNAVIQVQQAMLEGVDDAIAVFGPDGRLRFYNAAFLQLWRFKASELEGAPHLSTIDQMCAFRLGSDACWVSIIAAVSAIESNRRDAARTVRRADGRFLALSVTRLPDGSTMAAFSDQTDEIRFAAMLEEDRQGRKTGLVPGPDQSLPVQLFC